MISLAHRVTPMILTTLNLLKISQKSQTGQIHQIFRKGRGICKFFLLTSIALEKTKPIITAVIPHCLLSTLQILRPTILTCLLQETKPTQTSPEEANLLKDQMAQTQVILLFQAPQTGLLRLGHQVLQPKAPVTKAQLILRLQPRQVLHLQARQPVLLQTLRLQPA